MRLLDTVKCVDTNTLKPVKVKHGNIFSSVDVDETDINMGRMWRATVTVGAQIDVSTGLDSVEAEYYARKHLISMLAYEIYGDVENWIRDTLRDMYENEDLSYEEREYFAKMIGELAKRIEP